MVSTVFSHVITVRIFRHCMLCKLDDILIESFVSEIVHAASARCCARMNTNGSIFSCPFVSCHHHPTCSPLFHLIQHRAMLSRHFCLCCKCCQVCLHLLHHCQRHHVLLLSIRSTSSDRVSGLYQFHTGKVQNSPPPPSTQKTEERMLNKKKCKA